ncbi:MAG: hypothetical protein AB7K86_09725 [Rhodospirillales bacterium]
MAKGQKRSTREAKKPKQKKPSAAGPASSPAPPSASKQSTFIPSRKK